MVRFPFERTLRGLIRQVFYKSDGWSFSIYRKKMFCNEYAHWKQWYLPVDVKGLTVLDVGAGEGESARFFLEHGAKKVICIENDSACFRNLLANSKGQSIECFCRSFCIEDLAMPFDLLKMDIEGGEVALLDLPKLRCPVVVEVHGLSLAPKFIEKGYILKNPMGSNNDWLCYAYTKGVV